MGFSGNRVFAAVSSVMLVSFLSLWLFIPEAKAVLYAPGETLDPSCAPTDVDCGISSVVGEGSTGQIPFYAQDGGILSATSSITVLTNGDVSLSRALVVGDTSGTRANLGLTYASAIDIVGSTNIATWGDSLTYGTGGTAYPIVLASLSKYNVYNGGIGGQTSTQIKDRMLADTGRHSVPTIIWAGRNNNADSAQVQADIAEMVEALDHDNYLVLSVLNGGGEVEGSPEYDAIISLNNALEATYGDNYLDVRAYLVSQYDPEEPQDVIDHDNDAPPNSLRSDAIHLNSAGYALVAEYIYENFAVLQAPDRVLTVDNLRTFTFPSLGIGTSTPAAQLEVFGGNVVDTSIYISNTGSNTTDRNLALVFRQGVNDPATGGQGAGGKIVSGRDGLYGGSAASHNSNLQFYTANAGVDKEHLRITNAGYVGIGTTTPTARLDVAGFPTNSVVPLLRISSVNSLWATSTRMTLNSNGNLGLGTASPDDLLHLFAASSTQPITLKVQNTSASATAGAEILLSTSGSVTSTTVGASLHAVRTDLSAAGDTDLALRTSSGSSLTERMRILASGNVGVGTTSPWRRFSVTGTVGLDGLTSTTGAGSLCLSSSREVVYNSGSDNCLPSRRDTKDQILPLSHTSMDLIHQLEPVSFVYKDNTERTRYGFIAEDAQLVNKQLVTYDMDGEPSGLDTSGFLALIVGAVQELSESITTVVLNAAQGNFSDRVCIGSTCITESQLQELLEDTTPVQYVPPTPVEEVPVAPTPTEEVPQEPVDPTPAPPTPAPVEPPPAPVEPAPAPAVSTEVL